jgi:hypothetical protein
VLAATPETSKPDTCTTIWRDDALLDLMREFGARARRAEAN